MNDDKTLRALQAEKQKLLVELKGEEEKFKKGLTTVKQYRDAEVVISNRIKEIVIGISCIAASAKKTVEVR